MRIRQMFARMAIVADPTVRRGEAFAYRRPRVRTGCARECFAPTLRLASSLCALAALTLALLAPGAPAARAQGAFPSSPPPDLPARPVTLPAIETRTLPNGLKVVVAQSSRVPLVTLRLAIPAGSAADPKDAPGLAAAVASQLTAGTDKYTSLQLKEAAERLGGSISASANDDYTVVSTGALAENFRAITDLLADALLHPAFPESELAVYKSLTQQGLVVQRQNPAFLAQEQLAKALYGGHPYGTITTTAEAVNALAPAALRGFYDAHYVPEGAVLIVVGAIKPADAFDIVRAALGGWMGKLGAAASEPPAPTVPEGRTVYLVNRPGSVQSNILFGNVAIRRNDPDYYPLLVANAVLGAGASSRLFGDVRERLGYAYDVRSSAVPRLLAGDFTEAAQTRTAVTAPALAEMLKQEERIRTEPVSPTELAAAKALITGNFVLSLTSQSGLADRLLQMEVYHLPPDYVTKFKDRIDAVTAADVQRVAQKYMLPDRSAIVVVGDATQLRDALKQFGTVEEVH